jgi:hypothetical protein
VQPHTNCWRGARAGLEGELGCGGQPMWPFPWHARAPLQPPSPKPHARHRPGLPRSCCTGAPQRQHRGAQSRKAARLGRMCMLTPPTKNTRAHPGTTRACLRRCRLASPTPTTHNPKPDHEHAGATRACLRRCRWASPTPTTLNPPWPSRGAPALRCPHARTLLRAPHPALPPPHEHPSETQPHTPSSCRFGKGLPST